MSVLTTPKLSVSTAEDAISIVNLWLHTEVGMAVHTTKAKFNNITFCWHLPIEVAFPKRGTLGIVGDVYVHAATGEFIGQPEAADLIKRAEKLAEAFGIE
ncbi:MAG: hypothetical protein ACR2J3_07860 [Aridibacter sp.]